MFSKKDKDFTWIWHYPYEEYFESKLKKIYIQLFKKEDQMWIDTWDIFGSVK